MKTLFIVKGSPYPPLSGSPLRGWQNINVLATRGPVHVFSVGDREFGEYAMPVVAGWEHIDDSEFPQPPGLRSKIVRIASPRQYPVPDVCATAEINRRLRSTMERFGPDLIVLSHWKNAYPDALKARDDVILDMHNIESLLGTDVRGVRPSWLRALMLWRWRERERNLVRRASRTWVCGENDVRRLARLDRRLPRPVIWPNAIDVTRYANVRSGKTANANALERNDATLIYVGFYKYHPNAVAASALINKVFPLVAARIPQARLLLVGGAPTSEMTASAARDPRIVVTGHVEDVRDYLAVGDVSVVPLRTGGGTRMKILECFAANIPVVSTRVGAEGIEAVPGRDIRIADDDEDLAQNAVELLSDRNARTRQAEAAFRLVERLYSWSSLERLLGEALPLAPSAAQRHSARGIAFARRE